MKTKIYLMLLIFQFIILSCATSAPVVQADLIFIGTVEKLELSPMPNSTTNWIVHCRIDQVLFGNFSGKTFSFRVHSPSKSGLEVGKQYKIEAKQTTEGYTIDQYQWRK